MEAKIRVGLIALTTENDVPIQKTLYKLKYEVEQRKR